MKNPNTPDPAKAPTWPTYLLLAACLAGCSTLDSGKATRLLEEGKTREGLALLEDLAEQNPRQYRLSFVRERDAAISRLLDEARRLEAENHPQEAAGRYREVLGLDAVNIFARKALDNLEQQRRQSQWLDDALRARDQGEEEAARTALQRILTENPRQAGALKLLQELDLARNRDTLTDPPLKSTLSKPVSLEFRNAGLQAVFDVLAQSSGLNFIFDRDVKTDLKTTLFARDTSVEDALGLILRTNQLASKVLNDSTLLIYPDTPDKEKQYADLVVRSFYLGAADPKKVQDMLRAMVNPRAMYVDDKMRLLIVRDTLEVIGAVEKLVRNFDLVEPEVTLDVEILEVSHDKLLNLGIQYPDQIKVNAFGAAAKAGELTLNELTGLSRGDFKVYTPDPLATLNFKQTSGNANILANPRIRVRNREKAKVLIGDKVPVVTTTTNQTSSSVSESVSYLDVGLKLEVEPEIHVNQDVSINVGLEVSNIVKEVKSSTGLLTYQIGTRNANTVLRLRDGETQMLAGLIKDEERNSASHLPGLGKLPWLGKLFSNESGSRTKNEIVLLITPHIVRNLDTPGAASMEFLSGTGNQVSTRPLRLPRSGNLSLTNPDIMTGTSTPSSSPTARTGPAETVAPAGDDPSPLTGDLRLDLIAPAGITPGKEFRVALLLNGPAFRQLDFNLQLEGAGLTLVRATPMIPAEGFEYAPMAGGYRFHLGASPTHSGPLAMLILKTDDSQTGPVKLTLRDAEARDPADAPLSTGVAATKTLPVSP